MPTSREMTEANSSVRAARPSEIRARSFDLSAAGVADHSGNAAAAASTAFSASFAVPSGIFPITSSVFESITSKVPEPVDETQLPPIYTCLYSCIAYLPDFGAGYAPSLIRPRPLPAPS